VTPAAARTEKLAVDTPKATTEGATFFAPAGWTITARGATTLLEPPEGDAHIAFVDVRAKDADAALTIPADPAESGKLAKRYASEALGEIAVTQATGVTTFDFGEWKSAVATRKNPDGTISFLTIAPGAMGFEFVVGQGPKRTLITRDAQHEYVFTER